MNILGYSLVVNNGDGSSSTHYYKTREAAKDHLKWEEEEFGYCDGEVDEVRLDSFKDSFEKPW